MAKLDKYIYNPFPYEEEGTPIDEWLKLWNEQVALINKMEEESLAKPAEDIVGHVMTFPRGDGTAYYVVVKDKPLTLAWVPIGDKWTVDDYTIRGIRKTDIVADRKRMRNFSSIFGTSKFKMREE